MDSDSWTDIVSQDSQAHSNPTPTWLDQIDTNPDNTSIAEHSSAEKEHDKGDKDSATDDNSDSDTKHIVSGHDPHHH